MTHVYIVYLVRFESLREKIAVTCEKIAVHPMRIQESLAYPAMAALGPHARRILVLGGASGTMAQN